MAKKFISYALLAKYDGLIKSWVNGLITEANGDITTLEGLVNTLIGSDNGKSARTIANEEMAAVLLVDPEKGEKNFQTLQALAKYLEDHPEEVADILASIKKVDDKVGELPTILVADENGVNPGDENYIETTAPAYANVIAYVAKVAADLATEAATARAAEALNASNIAAEETRAKAAEDSLNEKIGHKAVAEVSHEATAEDVEAGKASAEGEKVVDVEGQEATGLQAEIDANAAAIAAEKARAEQAEKDLQDAIDEATKDLNDAAYTGVENADENQYVKVSEKVDNKQTLSVTIGSFTTKEAAQVPGLATIEDVEQVIVDNEKVTAAALNDLNDRLSVVEGEGEGSIKKAVIDLSNTTVSSTSGDDIKITLGGTVGAPTVTVAYEFATEEDIEALFVEESETPSEDQPVTE